MNRHLYVMDRNNLTTEMKTKIITMREYTSMNFEQIAVECGCSISTARFVWKKHEEDLIERLKTDRPNALSAEQKTSEFGVDPRNGHSLSMETKYKILTMRIYTAMPFEQIAADCGCSVSAARFVWKKHEEDLIERLKTDRPGVLSDEHETVVDPRNGHNLSMETEYRIIAMRTYTAMTFLQIATECGCSASAAKICWENHQENGNLIERLKDRPSAPSVEQETSELDVDDQNEYDLSVEIKAKIISMYIHTSMTIEQIAAKCECSVSAAKFCWDNYDEDEDLKGRSKKDRPSASSAKQENRELGVDDRNGHNLSMETKCKIIVLKAYTSKTFYQIAAECGCSVSDAKFCWENNDEDEDVSERSKTDRSSSSAEQETSELGVDPRNQQNLSIKTKYKIIAMRTYTSMTFKQIAAECGCNVSTANFWWKRHEDVGDLNSRKTSGRPSVLSGEQETEIIERINENPFFTAVSFAREYGVNISVISSLFLRHGFKCTPQGDIAHLTANDRIYRIAFCQMLLEQWDENKFESIIFSDETTFSTDDFRQENKGIDPKDVTVKDISGVHNYWGAIGIEGTVSPIVQVKGELNASKYEKILKSHVIPMMNRFEDDGVPRIFMQNNSPVHTNNSVMSLLSGQRFKLIDWPPKSNDLNPIENIWTRMIYGWPKINSKDEKDLHAVVVERWKSVGENKELFRHLYRSLRNRYQQVIDNDGDMCRY